MCWHVSAPEKVLTPGKVPTHANTSRCWHVPTHVMPIIWTLFGCWYTLGKKGCYTPMEDNKTNVDRTWIELVSTWLKLAWYGRVIIPQRNPTLPWADIQCKVKWDRRALKPQYRWSFPQINLHTVTTLNQYLHIFSKFFLIVRTMPRPKPLWVLGMRCLHLPVRALRQVLLLPVWVWLMLPSTSYSKVMLPLDLWCQASLQGLPERQHLGKTLHCWGWSDRIVFWVLGLDGADEQSVRNEGWSHKG